MCDVGAEDPAGQCLESKHRGARKAQRDSKPVLQRRANVAFRLQTARRKQTKAAEAVASQKKLLEAAQKSLQELHEMEAAVRREAAALGEELRRTMPPGAVQPFPGC